MLLNFKRAGVERTVEQLLRPRTLSMAGDLPDRQPATLTFKQVVTVDTELHIRHGTALTPQRCAMACDRSNCSTTTRGIGTQNPQHSRSHSRETLG